MKAIKRFIHRHISWRHTKHIYGEWRARNFYTHSLDNTNWMLHTSEVRRCEGCPVEAHQTRNSQRFSVDAPWWADKEAT